MLVDINLLPEKERERSTVLIAALAILGAAILFWAVLFLLSFSLSKETVRLETQIADVQASQEAIEELLQPSIDVDEQEKLSATVEWVEANRFNTLPLLRELVDLLPERGFFTTFAFTAPHESTVTVQFDDKAEAAYYLTRVKSSPVVSNAAMESLIAVRLGEGNDVETLLRFQATYRIEYVDGRGVIVEVEEPMDLDSKEDGSDE